jgi:hypothetical protein
MVQLRFQLPDGSFLTTWAFVLEERERERTRLIVRARAGPAYDFASVLRSVLPVRTPASLGRPLVRAGHFLMQRKQLHGIARRAEHRSPVLS